ncbi:MAG: hydroxymethylbilane synthase [Hyphomicrobiaceae bacterium]
MPDIRIKIGTRGSPLALAQAAEVQRKLSAAWEWPASRIAIVEIKTSGDAIQDRPLSEVGGKGLFTKEIESALLDGTVDVAVHSMKDLETQMPVGLALASVLEREDVRDAFISEKYASLAAMPAGAVVGTSSLRRRAQLKNVRPDLRVVEFRGNVQTRLRKLRDGIADATFLACAGLRRLDREDVIRSPISVEDMLPAVAQGAIALQIRSDDAETRRVTEPLNHETSEICTTVERAFLAKLDGSCRTPIAGLARLYDDQITFRGQILRPDGSERLDTEHSGPVDAAVTMAEAAADDLLGRAGTGFFDGTTS